MFYYAMHIGRAIKQKYIPDNHFWEVYTHSLHNGEVSAVNAMNQQASIARFTRAGFFNVLLIGISLCYFTSDLNVIWPVCCICILASIACFYTFRQTWDHWFCLMVNIFLLTGGDDKKLNKGIKYPWKRVILQVGIICLIFLVIYLFSILRLK
jgi:hypothetical protein